jgi:hypothetical protein
MVNKIVRWLQNIFHRRYIDLGKVARLEEKGITPFF